MKILLGDSKRVCQFVSDLVPRCRDGFDAAQGIGVIDAEGRLVAGWVWHNWDPTAETIEFSGAAITPKWMTRDILHWLFSYAFNGVGAQMILTRNSEHNTRLHRQLKTFGFDRYDIPRLFGRKEAGAVWFLTDDQWRAGKFYIESKCHEQTTRAHAA